MAEIKPYQQQVLPQGVPGGRQANASDMGAIAGGEISKGFFAAADEMYQKQEEVRKKAEKKAEEDAMYSASKQYADGQVYWRSWLKDQQTAVPKDDVNAASKFVDGMTDRFSTDYDKWAQDSIAAMPTEKAKRYMTLHLSQLKAGLQPGVMDYQANESGRLAVAGLQSTFSGNEQMVVQNPATLRSAIAAETNVIKTSAIKDPAKIEELVVQRRESLSNLALGAVVDDATARIDKVSVKQLQDMRTNLMTNLKGMGLEYAGGAQISKAVNQIDRLIETKNSYVDKVAVDALSEKIAERASGINNGLTPGAAGFIRDPYTRQRAEKEIQTAIVTGEATTKVQNASFGDLKTYIDDSVAALKNPGNYKQDKAVSEAMLNAVQARLKQEKDDFAGYVIGQNTAVSAAYKAVQTTNDPAAVAKYVNLVTSEQQRLNPLAPTALMPATDAHLLVNDITGRIAKGEAPGEVIGAQAAKWGRYWPQVYGQISKDLPPDVFNIGAGMRPADANFLASISQLKSGELKQGVDSTQLTGLDGKIAAKFKNFTGSMSGLPGGDRIVSNVLASNEKLVYAYMRQGLPVNQAIDKSYDALVGYKYQFNGQMRVPTSFDAGKVGKGSQSILDKLDTLPIQIPGIPSGQAARPDLHDLQVYPGDKSGDTSSFGKRPDGTPKGNGFLGVLRRPDGGVSTEISISTDKVSGRDFPLLVPTLSRKEVDQILSVPTDAKDFWQRVPKSAIQKAEAFAENRAKQGLPLFAAPNESPVSVVGGIRANEARTQYLRSIKNNAVWFTNSDESGAALYVKDVNGVYSVVRDDKGNPINYSWTNLLTGNPATRSVPTAGIK